MNVPAPEFLTDEQQLLYRRRGGFHIRSDTLRLLNTATGGGWRFAQFEVPF